MVRLFTENYKGEYPLEGAKLDAMESLVPVYLQMVQIMG